MTIEELLEIEAIKNVRIMYSHHYDGQNVDELCALFTDDAVCEFGPDFGGDWVGIEQIHANFSEYATSEGPVYGVLHAVTNPVIKLINDDTANGRWYLLDLRTTEGVDNPLILFGIYDDVYKKISGEWKIHRTKIDFLWPKRHYSGYRDPSKL